MFNLFVAPSVSPCFTRGVVTPTELRIVGDHNNMALSNSLEKLVSLYGDRCELSNPTLQPLTKE